ncbi:hypothetical protein EDB83DRAFT_2323524 [Lactarius deliciosus]|nr:hypothetical protein EDB83DRAFT_2323524 [Lactarius deliciosus]
MAHTHVIHSQIQTQIRTSKGSFPSVAYGISFGRGQKEPGYLHQSNPNEPVLGCHWAAPSIQRICNFGSRAFELYSYKNYQYMLDMLKKLQANHDLCQDEKRRLHHPYNSKEGGHLVLWDFGLMVEFPPGSIVLIPSALLKHSNTPIQTGKTHFSMIHWQYAAGGIFQWVENGFMSEEEHLANASKEQQRAYQAEQGIRWSSAEGMFTRLDKLSCT